MPGAPGIRPPTSTPFQGAPMSTPVPPYGVSIHAAIRTGDVAQMRAVAQHSEAWLKQADEVRAALATLHAEIARAEQRR